MRKYAHIVYINLSVTSMALNIHQQWLPSAIKNKLFLPVACIFLVLFSLQTEETHCVVSRQER